jgi:hypothetical protein
MVMFEQGMYGDVALWLGAVMDRDPNASSQNDRALNNF